MLVALILLALAVVVIAVVLGRRFGQAALLDVETIAAERQKQVKERLALERLKRSASAVGDRIKGTFAPVGKVVSTGAKSMYDKVLSLEKKYQEERRTSARPLKEGERDQVSALLDIAADLLEEGRFGEAEQEFIKVVSLDARNVAAYRGLARIYIETKQLDQARETVDFLLKIKPGNAESFAMRSEIAYLRGDLRVAEEEMSKACDADVENSTYCVDLAQILFEVKKYTEAAERMRTALTKDQNNPKYLDFLVETSILSGDARGAESALERLKAVNPENQKISEFEKRVKGM